MALFIIRLSMGAERIPEKIFEKNFKNCKKALDSEI